jgi:hypothetical protein
MVRKVWIPLLIAFIMVECGFAQEITVKVDVDKVISGKITHMNITTYPFVKIESIWENIGSVGCNVRIRIDVNGTTSWSEEKGIWPGGASHFENLVYLDKGDYSARVRVYYCNEIEEYQNVTFSVDKTPERTGKVKIIDVKADKEDLYIKLELNQTAKEIIVIPVEYPTGWIFEYGSADIENNKGEVSIRYKPTIWKETNVTLSVFTSDGKFFGKIVVPIQKREEKNSSQIFYIFLLYVAIAFIVVLVLKHLKIE